MFHLMFIEFVYLFWGNKINILYDVLFMFHLMIIEFMYLFWGKK